MNDNIKEIYERLKKVEAPPIDEKGLSESKSDRMQDAIFVSPGMTRAYNSLDQKTKDHMKWYGETYYAKVIDAIGQKPIENASQEIALALKSGLSVKDLTADEKYILRSQLGPNWFKQFARVSEDEDDLPVGDLKSIKSNSPN